MAITKKIPDTIYAANSFCPGCGHGIVIRLIGEVLDEMGMSDRAIGTLAVGCACLVNRSLAVDLLQSAHGRTAAAAAGIKRTRPANLVFTYQGDGDAISIGIAETLYSAQRGEKITQIIVNNGVFGMTGRADVAHDAGGSEDGDLGEGTQRRTQRRPGEHHGSAQPVRRGISCPGQRT